MKLEIQKKSLVVSTAEGLEKKFLFPAVAISVRGERIEAATAVKAPVRFGKSISAVYRDGGIEFEVRVTPGKGNWFFKEVTFRASEELPTPDYVELDRQKIPAGGMKLRGYIVSGKMTGRPGAEEEGGGLQPGCGYPVMGKELFAGVEHPAAFSSVNDDKTYSLRQHPVWQKNQIVCCRAVTGLDSNPEELFYSYLDTIRIPALKKPLVSFCSFWSDPYLGNYEYDVNPGNYSSLVNAFSALGIRPEVYTLDAGWHDRRSFFKAKKAFGGNAGLKKVGQLFREHGAELSLWVSHNGPMGMDWDFLKSKGIAVGAGESAAYCGDHYGVLLDPKLEKELCKRFCELASPEYGAVHFKIDWDNDCSTTPEFNEKYPTRDHVREGSIDAMIRISKAMRQVNPNVVIRNGWWPSPWWLMTVNHVFLADSGDSEYATYPALTQRAAAANHRDLMYYIELRRDGSLVPPDAFDNHEFPHARRNPFCEFPGDWADTCMWAVLRGASYLPMTLQPESLEDWQADILRKTLAFARKNASSIYTGNSRMVGGNPNAGEIYGFAHRKGKKQIFLALRNPAPTVQEYTVDTGFPHQVQIYPDFRRVQVGEKLIFGPHEVKLIAGTLDKVDLPSETPFMADAGKVWLPNSERPGVKEIYCLPELEALGCQFRKGEKGVEAEFGVRVPYRIRNSRLLLTLRNCGEAVPEIRLRYSRYEGWHKVSAYTFPVREVPVGVPGYGESKNPDMTCDPGCRYYVFDVPQGGEAFFNLEINGVELEQKDISLFYAGSMAPARAPEAESWKCSLLHGAPPPANPEGFSIAKQLI
ncbi:MAG: hypothetical protein E7048_05590 [Lentisphaerae bacterium]|nr:hypothetical protein [Lentisphaerota bacterium]